LPTKFERSESGRGGRAPDERPANVTWILEGFRGDPFGLRRSSREEGNFLPHGDRVRRPAGDGPLTHLGRIDSQVKILGHRVELGEVEAVVRQTSGRDGVVAIGWPATLSGYGGIEVFVEGEPVDVNLLRSATASRFPDYWSPKGGMS
jgi:acyl-coenzyme A synthetase/AMP-(fatty) acid ligase